MQSYSPPPIIILSQIKRFVLWVQRRCNDKRKVDSEDGALTKGRARINILAEQRRVLERFQERYTEVFLRNQQQEINSSDSAVINRINADVHRATSSIYELRRMADQLRRLAEAQDYRVELIGRQIGETLWTINNHVWWFSFSGCRSEDC